MAGIYKKDHNRQHSVTSPADHIAGNWKVFYSNGSGQVQELALGNAGTVLTSTGVSSAPTFASGGGGSGFINEFFGDISDGDATITSFTILTKTMMYNTLTINAGVTLSTLCWGLFARTLNLGSGSVISCNGANGSNASGASGGAGGLAPGSSSGRPYGTGTAGGNGGNAGSSGANGGLITIAMGVSGQHQGGSGGAGIGGGFGGTGGSISGYSGSYATQPFRLFWNYMIGSHILYSSNTVATVRGGTGGGGGGGGATFGGGGGGGGGGCLMVASRVVNAPTSGTAFIQANGGNGGNGGQDGGGGGGGGGGVAVLYCYTLNNPSNLIIQANGGLGGGGGQSGTNGQNGVAYMLQLSFT